jgi:hypothetical protein
MRTSSRRAFAFGSLTCLLTWGSSVFGVTDVLSISIANNSPTHLFVTVYDQNTNPPQLVLSTTVIDGNASIPVSISPDRSGMGHLSWTVMTVGPDMRRCGQDDKSELRNGDTVNVQTDSACEDF